nr:MAG TPA: hypothetical protein [Caudoviricetes sp.]
MTVFHRVSCLVRNILVMSGVSSMVFDIPWFLKNGNCSRNEG